MSGRISGVQAPLKEDCKDALYVHCSNHSRDLALQQVGREVTIVADTLVFVREVSITIRESAKRESLFKGMFEDGAVRLLGLCPTRWCIQVQNLGEKKINQLTSEDAASVLTEVRQMFNCDESGFVLGGGRMEKVLARKGDKPILHNEKDVQNNQSMILLPRWWTVCLMPSTAASFVTQTS